METRDVPAEQYLRQPGLTAVRSDISRIAEVSSRKAAVAAGRNVTKIECYNHACLVIYLLRPGQGCGVL